MGDRILEFLPDNIGMPLSEIARRLGQPDQLPAALDGLMQERLIERFSKNDREPEPMYRFAEGQRKRLAIAAALGLAELANESPRWRAESHSVRQLTRWLYLPEDGLKDRHLWRAMRRLARQGFARRMPRPPGKIIRAEDRYAITALGRRVMKCGEAISDFLPFYEDGRTMTFSTITARAQEEPEVVRAALDHEKDLDFCEEFSDGPDDPDPRFWSTFDTHAVYRWKGTWQSRLAKQVN